MPDTITYILPTFLTAYIRDGIDTLLEGWEIDDVKSWLHDQDVDKLVSIGNFTDTDAHDMRKIFLTCLCSIYTFTLNVNRQLISGEKLPE